MNPLVLTIQEAAETMKCGRTRIYELIADGTLVRGKQFGRKTVVIAESVFNALEATYHPAKPTPAERPAAKRRPAKQPHPAPPAFDPEAEAAAMEADKAAERKKR